MTPGPDSHFEWLRSTLARSDDPRTDGQLLAAFREHRDPDAFTALVHRHGPRVLGVCRRITGHDHDADDACQAVFLVLARRAADIRPPEAVGAWLYGVAYRTAQDARVMAARRRAKVTPTAELPDVPATKQLESDLELSAILDAEIAALPEHYRNAVVLCELQGCSRKEAAKRLGIAEGTLSSRLAEARKRLAAGLSRKGFALPAVLATAVPVAASETVFPLACRLGLLAAAGDQLPAGPPVALADLVTKIMFAKKIKTVAVLGLVGFLLLGGFVAYRFANAEDPKPVVQSKAEPQPKVEPQPKPEAKGDAAKLLNKLLIYRHGKAVLLDGLDAKTAKVVYEPRQDEAIREILLSPDGKKMLYLSITEPPEPKPGEEPKPHPMAVMIRDIDGQNPVKLDSTYFAAWWAPDGKAVLVADVVLSDKPDKPSEKLSARIVNVATKESKALVVPPAHVPLGLTPDGKALLVAHPDVSSWKPKITLIRISFDGKHIQTLTDPAYLANLGYLSPDGKTVVFSGSKIPENKPEEGPPSVQLFIQPVGGKVTQLPGFPKNAQLLGLRWSPEGKKIAYVWQQVHPVELQDGKPDERETLSQLCIYDIEAKTHTTILAEKGKGPNDATLFSVDWR